MEEEDDESRHVQARAHSNILCQWSDDFRCRQRHGLEHKMAGTPVIRHTSIGKRRRIPSCDETRGRPGLPFTKTGETGQLDSKEENQTDKQYICASPFQHKLSLQRYAEHNIA